VRFLLDEMFPVGAAEELRSAGHDAASVAELDLLATPDAEIFGRAVTDDRVIVTENFQDFATLLELRSTREERLFPVVFVRKSSLPKGARRMSHALAERLVRWCENNPEPYRHAHWLA
jgi:predicted nuclease of predicted toxin-antitoxin system